MPSLRSQWEDACRNVTVYASALPVNHPTVVHAIRRRNRLAHDLLTKQS